MTPSQQAPGAEPAERPLRIFLVAGEHSGDALGAKLMTELRAGTRGAVTFSGVGGDLMEAEGLASLFPIHQVAVMGPVNILKQLPRLIRRVKETARAGVAANPDIVVIIDSPEFTHPIAKRIRKAAPHIPIVDYVSPSVWAWRPGRAKKMRAYTDHVLALLPFEPEAHQRLGGPPCTYVGHALSERTAWIAARDGDELRARLGLDAAKPVVVVLPGSRASEVTRLMPPFGAALTELDAQVPGGISIVLPVVASVRTLVEKQLAVWPAPVTLIEGEADKFAAFRLARAALAASGTVTLELGLAGTPAVVAYKVDALAANLRFLLKVPSIVLANLVAGSNIYPEFIQEEVTAQKLAGALRPLLSDTPQRARQIESLAQIPARLDTGGERPSEVAARIVLALARTGRRPV